MIQLQNICNFYKRGIKLLVLFTLFSTTLFSNSLKSEIERQKLYNDIYWSKLLHYRNGVSEIDSDNFFVSKNGKTNLKEELFETIKALENADKDVYCRFPLRVLWLKEKLPSLNIKEYNCPDLNLYLQDMGTSKISVIFPSSHINSPASMYGHTFLQVQGSEQTSLISNAINFAAQTNETNGFIFAYKGIFGGYKGKYSILPYYKKIKEYNNLEQRDIWEYELAFNEEEIKKIVLHSFELKDSYSYYYFFLENCSYNILWLYEIAKPSLNLVNEFKVKAAPLDTVKILEKNKLIVSSKYRYSKMKKMNYLYEKIKDKSQLKSFIKDDKELKSNLSFEDKVAYLDLKVEYIKYLRTQNKFNKEDYLKTYLKYLKQRSSLKEKSVFNINDEKNPLYSHSSSKLSFTYDSQDNILFSIKPVYNDLYDVSDGYLNGAFIDFFKLDIKKNKNKTYIDKFVLLDIKSYASRNELFKPLSWGINLSYERFINDEDFFKIKPQFGLTYSFSQNYIFSMLHANSYNKANNNLSSIGFNLGYISNSINNTKFGLTYEFDKYNKDFYNRKFEAFTTYKVKKDLSLNLKYENEEIKKKEDTLSLSIFYYF